MRRLASVGLVLGFAAVIFGCGGRTVEYSEPQVEPETDFRVEFRVPTGLDPSEPVPLLVVLHGHERTEEQGVDLWDGRFFSDPDFILASVRAPFNADEGYAWFSQSPEVAEDWRTREKRSIRAIEDRVLDAVDKAEEAYEIDPDAIYVMGFSQGANAAFCAGLRNPDVFAGVAGIAGNVDTVVVDLDRLEDVEDMAAFIALGRGEGERAVEAVRSSGNRLRSLGMDTQVFLHDGGHIITPEIVSEMQDFLGLGGSGSTVDDEFEEEFEDYGSEYEDDEEDERYLGLDGEAEDEYYEEESEDY